MRTYTDLKKLSTFESRFRYLKLPGILYEETFGHDRYLNQMFYKSAEWRQVRNFVITRDNGCDLGIDGMDILDRIYIHHMNPIDKDDVIQHSEFLLNPEYLICVSYQTHQAIHYGDESLLFVEPVVRRANDTCPWR